MFALCPIMGTLANSEDQEMPQNAASDQGVCINDRIFY